MQWPSGMILVKSAIYTRREMHNNVINTNYRITIYRKSSLTGQFVHLSSFTTWWCRNNAWSRACLIYRANKICSNSNLLRNELQNISVFAPWNGFPCLLVNRLLQTFTLSTNSNATDNDKDNDTDPPKIWIHQPFIGKRGTTLIRACTTKISRLLYDRVKFITLWDTTKANAVVYKFICHGWHAFYIRFEYPITYSSQEFYRLLYLYLRIVILAMSNLESQKKTLMSGDIELNPCKQIKHSHTKLTLNSYI